MPEQSKYGNTRILAENSRDKDFFDNQIDKLITKEDYNKDIAVRDDKGFIIQNDVQINNSIEFELSSNSTFYNIHHSGNKFYINGSNDIFITDEQLNILKVFDYNLNNNYINGFVISTINETGDKIYFANQNVPGVLAVLDLTTEELRFRGYGSPEGILFNASYMPGPSGWSDLSDIADRSYSSFPGALDYTPPNSIGEEMVMWDTINNKYYTIMFSVWQAGGAGGAISYDRQEILSLNPTVLGPTVSFVKPNFGTDIDIIEGNAQLTRGNSQGLYNPALEPNNTNSYTWDINYNPVNNKVYTYDYEQGKILILTDDLILESTITPIANVNPWTTAYSLGINTTNGDIYIIDYYGTVLVYDINNNKVADIDPAIPFNNNGEDLLVYNPTNDTMYISDRYNTVYLFNGTTRTLSATLDLTPYILNGISYLNSLSYSNGEVLISGVDFSNEGIIIKIANDNTITNLRDGYLSDRSLIGKIIRNTIKVNGQYAYVYDDLFNIGLYKASYVEYIPPTFETYENKIIGGLSSTDRTHQLQDADGIIAHLSDIPIVPPVYINNVEISDGLLVDSNKLSFSLNTNKILWVDQQYGNDGTALPYKMNRPYSTITTALFYANSGDLIWIRPGDYNEQIILKNQVNIHCDPNVIFGTSGGSFAMGDNGNSVTCRITGKPTLNRRYQNTALSISGTATNFYGDFNEIRAAGSVFAIGGTKDTNIHIKCVNVLDSMFNGMFYRIGGEPNVTFECTGYCTAGGAYGPYFSGQRWLFIFLNEIGIPFTGKFDVKINELRIPETPSSGPFSDYGNFGTQGSSSAGTVNIEIEKIVDNLTLSDCPALFYNTSSTKWNIKVNQPFIITRRPLISVSGNLSPKKGELIFSGDATCVNFTPITHSSADQRLIIKDSKISRSSGVSDSNLIINQTVDGGYLKIQNSILHKGSLGTLTDTMINLTGLTSIINFLNSIIILEGTTGNSIDSVNPINIYFNNTISNVDNSNNVTDIAQVSGFIGNDTNIINIL